MTEKENDKKDDSVSGGARVLTPSPFDSFTQHERDILQARALQYAAREVVEERSTIPYIRFRLGGTEHYGVPYEISDEVMPFTGLSGVPGTPDFVAGVVNRRGKLTTVIDLKSFFKVRGVGNSNEESVVIVSSEGLTVGFLVDEIIGYDEFDPAGLSKPLCSEGVTEIKYVLGIYEGIVTMIDVLNLLADPAILVGKPGQDSAWG